jgi:glutamine synthetase type III
MGRVIQTDSTGKQRNQLMRTVAELLRHLSQKQQIDAEVRDMVSTLVYCLREIEAGLEQSAAAWEKRDYWVKAEELRQRWHWVGDMADQLRGVVLEDNWANMPTLIVKLLPRVADIKVTKFTRSEKIWKGAYDRLLHEKPK